MRRLCCILTLLLLPATGWGANYLGTAPTLVEDCESTTGWTVYGTDTGVPTFALDSTYYKTGSHSLKFQQDNVGAGFKVSRYKDFTAIDMSSMDGFAMWVYVPARTFGSYIQFYFATNHNFTNYATLVLGSGFSTGSPRNGWNLYQFKKSDFTETSMNWASVGTVLIKFFTNSADVIYVDSIYTNVNARPKVILTMDDSDPSQVAAIQYANTKNIPVTAYVIADVLRTGGNLTSWQTLYAAGNDVCVHGMSTLTTLTLAEAETDMRYNRDYLTTNSMPRCANHIAWIGGLFNSDLKSLAATIGFSTAASLEGATGQVNSYDFENHAMGVAEPYVINRASIKTADLSLASAEADIDSAIANGKTVIFYLHSVGDGMEISTANWQAICDYIKTKVDAGLIDAVTISQWYSGMNATAISDNTNYMPYAGDVEIWNNNLTLNNLTVSGIIWNYGTGTTVNNTIAYKANNYTGIYSVSSMTGNNNLFVGATSTGPGTYTDTETIWNSNPIFVSTSDFHIQSSSPAINAGVDVGLTTDYAGNAIRGLPDIGAYEFYGDLPLPAAPANLSATPVSSSQVNLIWTDQSGNETGFQIERKTGAGGTYAQIVTVASNATTYSDSGLVEGTTYLYRVRAVNGTGNSAYSNEANATTPSSGTGGGGGGGGGACSISPEGKSKGESPLGTMFALLSPGILLIGRKARRKIQNKKFSSTLSG